MHVGIVLTLFDIVPTLPTLIRRSVVEHELPVASMVLPDGPATDWNLSMTPSSA